LSALVDLERAVADFEEQFHRAGAVSVVQVRANKSGEKRKSHKEGSRARPQIDSTEEDLPCSSRRMSEAASLESGEDSGAKERKQDSRTKADC
jgi:hypothetical protein